MKAIVFGLAMLIIFSSVSSCQQSKQPILYESGFKVIKAVDSSRVYKTDSDNRHYLHYRPLDIDVWYPAQKPVQDSFLLFGHYLTLFESRANYYTDSQAGNGLANQFAKSFSEQLKCSTPEQILAYPTKTLKNAGEAPGKFPLIIYLASYNGMGYENIELLETLTRSGYVVAAISSIGRYPGDMTMQQPDLMEQVKDASFTLNRLKKLRHVDSTRIGVLGYSWGGMAGTILAMSRTDINALISLDGSEFHHYGFEKEDDANFNNIIASADFRKKMISTPYLRLESSVAEINDKDETENKKDSVYNFLGKLAGEKHIYKILQASHGDFSYLPSIVKRSGNCKTNESYATITKLVLGYFNQQLKQIPRQVFADSLKTESGKTVQTIL